jgi:cobalt-zinc-cadmium efflux system membrane fusion protein
MNAAAQAAVLALLACACSHAVSNGHAAEEAKTKPSQALAIPRESPSRRFLEIQTVKLAKGQRELAAVGRVTFDEARVVNIATPLSGRAAEVLVRVGDVVKSGQPLLSVDSPEIPAIRADLRKALVDLRAAEKNLERVIILIKEKAMAEKDRLTAEVDRDKAAAEVNRLRARLRLLGKEEGDESQRFLIRAPRGGVVVKRLVNIGEEVRGDGANPLLVLADLSAVWVIAEVPERDLLLVQKGRKAEVEVTSFPGKRYRGKVNHIGEVVNPDTRTIQVRVVLKNPKRQLKPEMYARLFLDVTGHKPRLVIPSRALVMRHDQMIVFVEEVPGKFMPRKVVVGAELGDDREVVSGLKEGERIITRGAILLDTEIQRVL